MSEQVALLPHLYRCNNCDRLAPVDALNYSSRKNPDRDILLCDPCFKEYQAQTRKPQSARLRGVAARQAIVRLLNNSRIALDVDHIRDYVGLVNWESAKSILLELALEGQIRGIKTTHGWIFVGLSSSGVQ